MNDFDIWQKAINKMDLTEAVAPVVRGVMLVEDSQVEMYNKIQKLLNSTGMESCHRFLYNLDPSELSESECQKVCNLYKLGQDRGFIEPDVVEDEKEDNTEAEIKKECDLDSSAQPIPPAPQVIPMQQSAFTVLYSATRDGIVKSGEAFSNCVNTRSAKADVISKLERAGYQNISILAIEAGDPDMIGCDNTYCAQAAQSIPDYSCESDDDAEDVDEADDREPLSHSLDMVGVKASTANSKAQDAVQLNIEEKDEEKDEESDTAEDDASDDKSDDKSDNKEKKDDSDDSDKKKDKEEAAEEPDEKLKDDTDSDDESKDDKNDNKEDEDDEELSAADKENLKDSYKKAFKAAMKKCKFETSFSELNLEDKVQFFTELSKAWGNKADPSKFMTDKEVDQLEKIVVTK